MPKVTRSRRASTFSGLLLGSGLGLLTACTPPPSGQVAHGTFDIPFDKLPGGRMNAAGELDPTSSPEDAHKGAFVAAKKLGLMHNFEWLHWLPPAQ